MLMSPVLESPPAPFTVKVSFDVMLVLPIETPLTLLLLLVSVPPIVRLEPPEPRVLSVEPERGAADDAQIAGRRDLGAVL